MTVGIAIRVARPADIARLSSTLGTPHGDFFAGRLPLQEAGLGEVLVAWRGGAPVGAVFVSWDVADEPEVRKHLADVPMISHLQVADAHRHRGVGRTLLRHAEQRLRWRGHTRVLLGVDKSNEVARRLYEWLGYVQPDEPELCDLGAEPGRTADPAAETYDILVADLYRGGPGWP
ncbi:GNAT family N-acetyltransferase [Krasilnikovia sp. MM14-A1004]|uniref:GNAT family N-acetyltransferase n=1 Tax=Krasilnikovia sp. MM14-A1004 TaxID=3373541 RepID=UPI00399D181B